MQIQMRIMMNASTMPETSKTQPDPNDHPDAPFWNRMAARYARTPVKDEEAYRTKLAMTQDYLDDTSTVVELGCGTGSTALHHAPRVHRILATDVSQKMVRIAQTKREEAGVHNVDFEVASAEQTTVPPASADIVMVHSLLHLVDDRDALLARVRDWLKPQGALVTSTPCLNDMVPWLRFFAPLGRMVGLFPPSLRFFSEAELTASLERVGFLIERRYRPDEKAAVFLIARKAD
ncbi:MAG: class I SAM-dependent methyltransferase [Pseudomonadota bacterium]